MFRVDTRTACMQACEAQTCPAALPCMHASLRTAQLPVAAAGVAARALTAAACHPACATQQHAASLPLWRDLLSESAACRPALAAAVRWFAVFARVYPSNDYTSAVPERLLRPTATAGGACEPSFLQLLQDAQKGAAAAPHTERPLEGAGTLLLALQQSMGAGHRTVTDVMGSTGGAGRQERAALVAAALQTDVVSLAQSVAGVSGNPEGGSVGGEAQGSGRGDGAGAGVARPGGGFGSATARSEALRDVLSTLHEIHAAEARDGGPMARGISLACQQLQAVVNAGSGGAR